MTEDPLHSAIRDAIGLMADKPEVDDDVLRALGVRLALAQAAADDEINLLAVEGLQQTLEDAVAEADPAGRAFLYGELATSLVAYETQLQIDAAKAARGGMH